MSKNKFKSQIDAKVIAGICLIAFSALVFLFSCIPSFLSIGKFFQGVFGITIYPLCLLTCLVGVAWLMRLKYTFSGRFTFFLIAAIVCLLGLVHTIVSSKALVGTYTKFSNFGAYLSSIYRMESGISVGGALMGILVFLLRALVGVGGTYVIFAVLATIFVGLIVDYIIYSKNRKKKAAPAEAVNPVSASEGLKNIDRNSGLATEEYSFANKAKNSHVFEEMEQPEQQPAYETTALSDLFEADAGVDYSFNSASEPSSFDEPEEEEKTQISPRENAKNVLFGSSYGKNQENEDEEEEQEAPKSAHEILFGTAPRVPNIFDHSSDERDDWRKQYSSSPLGFAENKDNGSESPAEPYSASDNTMADSDEEVVKTSWGEYRPSRIAPSVVGQDAAESNIFARKEDNSSQERISRIRERGEGLRRSPLAEAGEDDSQAGINGAPADRVAGSRFGREGLGSRQETDGSFAASSDRFCSDRLDRGGVGGLRERTSVSNFNREEPASQPAGQVPNRAADRRASSDILANASSLGIEMKPEQNNFASVLPSRDRGSRLGSAEVAREVKPTFSSSRSKPYTPPPTNILKVYKEEHEDYSAEYKLKSEILENTLASFKIPAKVINVVRGPKVTRYEMTMPTGIPVMKILSHDRDISMNLATRSGVRIEAPIPGKNAFGVEVENDKSSTVGFRELVESPEFVNFKAPLAIAIGKNISGEVIIKSLAKMVHMLVAGSTGSGKSVFLHSAIMSLMYRYSPEELRFIMIDPKRVEFSRYNHMPHLMLPEVVNDCSKAVSSLSWAVKEMERRYTLLEQNGCRQIEAFNQCAAVKNGEEPKMPYLVIIVDELAELMSAAKKEVEGRIQRITQLGRAAGIHMIVATQRPSVDVVTGVIKNNLPTRVALSLASAVDSMTVINQGGAEKLLGWGDMLLSAQDSNQIVRLQGAFVSDEEIDKALEFIKAHNECVYDEEVEKSIYAESNSGDSQGSDEGSGGGSGEDKMDELLPQALKLFMQSGKASISMIQRRFSVGFSRAARIIDQMETRGYIEGGIDNKPRSVKITQEEFDQLFGNVGNN